MSSIVIAGDTSGSITLSAPAVSGANIATLPAATGELSMLGGAGQTWQNVTVSRAVATTYTNDTGKPIMLILSTLAATGGTIIGISASVNGGAPIRFIYSQVNTGNQTASGSFLVPNGATYSITRTSGTSTIEQWWELR